MSGKILRLSARATLDEPDPEVEHAEEAAANGDESWARWVEDYRRGEALVLRLRTRLELELPDGDVEVETMVNHAVWVEAGRDVPLVEEQVREVAGKDFAHLAARSTELGVPLSTSDLDCMYVHVTLDGEVRDRLAAAAQRGNASARAVGP